MKKIMFVGLVLSMILLFACAPMEVAEPETTPPAEEAPPIVEETPSAAPESAEMEVLPESTIPESYLTDLECDEDAIKVTVTNLGDEAWEGINVYLNGGWDKEPGCEKYELEPGESTTCDAIDFPVVYQGGKENVVQIDANGKSLLLRINCP